MKWVPKVTTEDVQAFHIVVIRDPCAYCGDRLQAWRHLDHIHPVSRGGEEHPDNWTAACNKCNASKCARDLFPWIIRTRGELGKKWPKA
jgi:5-methylcytosine-specific restriction endonuclease McrA